MLHTVDSDDESVIVPSIQDDFFHPSLVTKVNLDHVYESYDY